MQKRFFLIGLLLAAVLANRIALAAEPAPITSAEQVRALTAVEAAEARLVHLRGVVLTGADPVDHALIVIDPSGGIYALAASDILARYRRGDLLELTGVTDPGEFAPIVKVSHANRIGTAPIPDPRPVTYHQIITGIMDAQWVELSGIVQQFNPPAPGSSTWRMELVVDGGLLHIRGDGPHDPDIREDTEVRVHALCFYQFNQKRQMLGPVLQVPTGIPIIVTKPAPDDPFSAPIRPAGSLLLFSLGSSFGHRVHVRGVVTHADPGSLVWIRDESAGLRVQTRSAQHVQTGDVIDVIGFPKFGSAMPELEDAIFRKVKTITPPAPIPLKNPIDAFDHSDDLVSVEAQLTEIKSIYGGMVMSLELADLTVEAVIKLPPNTDAIPDWQPGSVVRASGICTVTYDDRRPVMGVWHPQSFQLLLRSPADLVVLKQPSWWTLQHLAHVLGIALGVMLFATGIIALLARRRLGEQTRQRAMAEAEFAAILSERNRVAREIHDTLAQGLAATSVQLRLAKKQTNGDNEQLVRYLDAAQELVRSNLQEARDTIWNMRSQVLETSDLPTALRNILNQTVEGSALKTDFQVRGRPRRLAPVVENNLLRAGQEAITNAARHAKARNISVVLDFGERQFRLEIKDDGRGFDPDNQTRSKRFGIVGMRERATELKGELKIRSAPNQGTEITMTVPLSMDANYSNG
ncbi:MAG TPA: sensor histidine kinase [Verrucomicrobiae bacterium]|nr:sensor histidine kinase [Verrucomicrobiae bacterium]